jgi:serine/threonine-protein phosphatase 2A activator
LTKEDLERFQTSESYTDFMNLIEELNSSIKNLKLTDDYFKSSATLKLLEILDTISGWTDQFPPQV